MPWWFVPKKRPPVPPEGSPDERRRRYAAEIVRSAGISHGRVEDAFAAIARKKYLPPPPWTVSPPGAFLMKDPPNPADLYEDVLVVLDRSRGINNGQPSL